LTPLIDELVKWGYLRRQRNPLNRKLRIYSVIYNEKSGTVGHATNNQADAVRESSVESPAGLPTAPERLQSWSTHQELKPDSWSRSEQPDDISEG
jgi:hypothetical protein